MFGEYFSVVTERLPFEWVDETGIAPDGRLRGGYFVQEVLLQRIGLEVQVLGHAPGVDLDPQRCEHCLLTEEDVLSLVVQREPRVVVESRCGFVDKSGRPGAGR